MISVSKTSLAYARTAVLMTQKELAKNAGISQVTIARCEAGDAVQLLTAQKVLAAINDARRERNLAPLELEDIDWNISQ